MKNKSSTRCAQAGHLKCRTLILTHNRLAESGFIRVRTLLGLTLALSGVALAFFAGKDAKVQGTSERERYMPVPGANTGDEAARLAELEQYWHDRLTFPTGRFDPAWLRAAAAQHAGIASGVPAGKHF